MGARGLQRERAGLHGRVVAGLERDAEPPCDLVEHSTHGGMLEFGYRGSAVVEHNPGQELINIPCNHKR